MPPLWWRTRNNMNPIKVRIWHRGGRTFWVKDPKKIQFWLMMAKNYPPLEEGGMPMQSAVSITKND